jgi:uncharacterized protein YciW
VTRRARWVTLRARWVTLRARWVTLRARWVTLRARWVTQAAAAEAALAARVRTLEDDLAATKAQVCGAIELHAPYRTPTCTPSKPC